MVKLLTWATHSEQPAEGTVVLYQYSFRIQQYLIIIIIPATVLLIDSNQRCRDSNVNANTYCHLPGQK